MKTLMRIFIISLIIFLSSSSSFSTPISGIYSVGSGGDYSTINSAISEITAKGISGPVTLKILPGIYEEQIVINPIPGSNNYNTLTLKSHSGSPSDVKIMYPDNFILGFNGAENIIIDGLTFSRANNNVIKIEFQNNGSNINLINNIFTKEPGTGNEGRDICANGNIQLSKVLIEGNTFNPELEQIKITSNLTSSNIRIVNNRLLASGSTNFLVPQSVSVHNCDSVLIEKNTISILLRGNAIGITNCKSFKISKNVVKGDGLPLNISSSGILDEQSVISNNFFIYSGPSGLIFNRIIINNSVNILFIFNSIYGDGVFIRFSNDISLINNIFSFTSDITAMYIDNSVIYSEYNNFDDVISAYLFYHYGVYYSNLTDFKNATNLDQHSGTHNVNFVSSNDLHLTGLSIGNENLVGIPLSNVIDDIDSQPRDVLYPYKGADEANVVLPVELSSFTSAVMENDVKLTWTTSSENNNSGFDVESSNVKGQMSDKWMKIGFVKGNGTTTTQNNYEFTDRNLKSGRYNYRLKQTDFNGNFKYHELSDEVVIGIPIQFELAQNYPNPFNPVTVIRYELPSDNYVSIKVYDINGKEVSTLVSKLENAGVHSVNFNGSSFTSGQYFYKLETGSYSEVRKMILVK